MYCEAPDCEREMFRSNLCAVHLKRKQRGQDLSAPIAPKLTALQRAFEAVNDWLEADSEDDAAYDAKYRSALVAIRAAGLKTIGARIREGKARGAANGVHQGRPRRFSAVEVARQLRKLGSRAKVAEVLGVSRVTVWRALQKSDFRNAADRPVHGRDDAGPSPEGRTR